ncbi:hypothetical protein B0H14DRAFT_1326131 [Mycena olivaceomarginata]|nr:hypothetical protein B0H14DRAFT_1326131 [Mycena olivaceomarginata]
MNPSHRIRARPTLAPPLSSVSSTSTFPRSSMMLRDWDFGAPQQHARGRDWWGFWRFVLRSQRRHRQAAGTLARGAREARCGGGVLGGTRLSVVGGRSVFVRSTRIRALAGPETDAGRCVSVRWGVWRFPRLARGVGSGRMCCGGTRPPPNSDSRNA